MQAVSLVRMLFDVYSVIMLLRVVVSWVQVDPYTNPIVRLIYQLTEPVLAPIRRLLPPAGGMDFSPLLALILIQVLESIVTSAMLGR